MTTPVAVYARHSTDMQSDSTRDQIARCEDYCRDRGYLVAGVFRDEAINDRVTYINQPSINSEWFNLKVKEDAG